MNWCCKIHSDAVWWIFTPDLMRRQEELRRLEELRNQELQKRKQMEMRYTLEFLITRVGYHFEFSDSAY